MAYIDGDNLLSRVTDLAASGDLQPFADTTLGDPGKYLSANAYLGCWGIVDALTRGADIVITGRVTDAAVVCGPAAWHHGWARDDWDQLAGAVVAGHVIECSAQATGGNYSFFTEIPGIDQPGGARFGFPWADVASDGSSVIGKHDGTGGQVSVGTITSQLLYEIGGPEYLGPDVTTRFDTIELEDVGRDRVRVSGVKGQAPPSTLKVAMNELGGFRNSFTVALTGLDVEAKAEFAQAAFWDACPYEPSDFEAITSNVVRTDKPDPGTEEEATGIWRVTVKDPDERKVGRAFSDALIHTALASIPGFHGLGGGPTAGRPFGVYRPALVESELVPQYSHIMGGTTNMIDSVAPSADAIDVAVASPAPLPQGPAVDVPIGSIIGARSGDKGGDANLGLFARTDEAWAWLDNTMTTDELRRLLPEAGDMDIERHRFPKIRSLNFVIHGLLEEGVAASSRQDSQAKALGEWLRARVASIPESVLAAGS